MRRFQNFFAAAYGPSFSEDLLLKLLGGEDPIMGATEVVYEEGPGGEHPMCCDLLADGRGGRAIATGWDEDAMLTSKQYQKSPTPDLGVLTSLEISRSYRESLSAV